MIRFLILIGLAYLAFHVIRRYLGPGRKTETPPESGQIDEMVQDPFCKTYVPRRTAHRRVIGGKECFFCSEACAERFEKETMGS